MSNVMMVRRRGFLKTTFSTGALILCSRLIPRDAPDAFALEKEWYPSVYLGIEPTGTVIIVAHYLVA